MDQSPGRPERRSGERSPPHKVADITCLRGTLGLGPNLAVSLLELSAEGASLVLREALKQGEEVELSLEGVGRGRPVRVVADVVGSAPAGGGHHRVEVLFQRTLSYNEMFDLVHLGG